MRKENETKIICVTPVRNEAWMLERFLRATELWADHIVLADQGSTDGTRDIAARFEKVRLIENTSPTYDEGGRQRLLLNAAREVDGRRFVIALDADELLTPTWQDSSEWQRALEAAPGTAFAFDWVNILADRGSAYVPARKVPFAFVDDGSDHAGERIHSTRLPVPDPDAVQELTDVKVLHLQFTDWRRMKSKQRWYQCWEVLNHAKKRPAQIYRQYHRMDAFPAAEISQTDPAWFERYRAWGIDLTSPPSAEPLWWDEEVLQWILEHGPARFRKLDIWDVSWSDVAHQLDRAFDADVVSDPRGRLDHRVLRWLANTQDRVDSTRTRWLQRMLILIGW